MDLVSRADGAVTCPARQFVFGVVMERGARPNASTSLLEPDLERVARLIEGPEAEVVAAELYRVQKTRGAAYRDGGALHPLTLEWIRLSNESLALHPGAACLVRKRVKDLPRLLGAGVPVELFPPPVLQSSSQVVTVIGIVRDLCSYRVVAAIGEDPEREFDGPVPMGQTLSTEDALAWSGLTYAALARARRADADLIAAVEVCRGIYFYRVRPFLRWLKRGRRGG